jgi:hypothetical protein
VPAPGERLGEGLGGEVVGQFGTDPASQVAVDRREVPIEQLSEACRLRQRRGDQFGIVRCCLSLSGVVTRCMTVAAVGVAPTPSPCGWRDQLRRGRAKQTVMRRPERLTRGSAVHPHAASPQQPSTSPATVFNSSRETDLS